MMPSAPRILIIDDLFGRRVSGGRNHERADLCAQLLLRDVTDAESASSAPRLRESVADVVFLRGQTPAEAHVGDVVENDIAGTLASIRDAWEAHPERRCALLLLDLSFKTGRVTVDSETNAQGMPEGRPEDGEPTRYFGLQLLERVSDEFPDLPVLILSSQDRAEVSKLYAERRGLGFIERDRATPDQLRDHIRHHGLLPDLSGKILGHSRALLLALRQARQVARSGDGWSNLLLRGETGTGKELFARFINDHVGTTEKSRPLVVVDSSVLSLTLFESEMFGHKKGAYTDAREQRGGLVAAAEGGDLFLDEIGNAPPEIQAKLLRLVQERIVVRLGEDRGRRIDVRFLSATNFDIESSAGSFRADLLYRLREGGTVVLPPLRERRDDIPILAEHFVREAESKLPGARRREISAEVIEALKQREWPGNVREIRSRLYEAVGRYRDVDHLLPMHIDFGPAPAAAAAPASPAASSASAGQVTPASVDDLVGVLDAFSFDSTRASSISGKLPVLYGACARLIARCVAATLHATKKVRPDAPDGTAEYQPAMKLGMGDASISGTKAADLVKKFLRLSPADISTEMRDPLVRAALDRATKSRTTKGQREKQPSGPSES